MAKPINKDYLASSLKSFDEQILSKKYDEIHSNREIIDKLTESEDGKLLFNGEEIQGGSSKSAYEIACDHGFEGTEEEWIASLEGKDGRGIMSIDLDGENFISATYSDGDTQEIGKIEVDVSGDFVTEEGFGKLRFYDGVFQYYDEGTASWVDFQMVTGNSYILEITPKTMPFFALTFDRTLKTYKFRFTEPNDTIIDGQSVCIVEGIKFVRKQDSEPIDENDGELILDIKRTEFGRYATNYFVDETVPVEIGQKWYYKAFPYSNTGIVCYSSENSRHMTANDYSFYGFRINQSESDPSSMITYISGTDNEFYNSAYMDYTLGKFNYGDWKEAWFINELKVCMLNNDGTVAYDVQPNNYTLKLDGSTAPIDDISVSGNVMVGIPLIYYKIVQNEDENICDFYFSDKQLDDDYKCWAHINNDGDIIPYTYISAYSGNSDGRSISGQTAYVGVKNGVQSTFSALGIKSNPTDSNIWNLCTVTDRALITLLLLLISKNTNAQDIYGYGVSNTTGAMGISGTGNSSGLFYGSSASTSNVTKVFGIENFWHGYCEAVAGLFSNGSNLYGKFTYGQEDGSTVDGYDDTAGYIYLNTIPYTSTSSTSYSYITKMNFTNYGFMYPKAASGGSATTYFCDTMLSSTTDTYPSFSISGSGAGAGIFAMNNWYIRYGSYHLSCKPQLSAF